MNKKRMLRKIVALALCLTMALYAVRWMSPVYAAGESSTVYTFGDTKGSFRDLYEEHQKEVKQRGKERKKAAQKEAMREKAAMKRAAREARQREAREKAAKNAEEGNAQ